MDRIAAIDATEAAELRARIAELEAQLRNKSARVAKLSRDNAVEAELRWLAENAPVSLARCDRERRYVFVNAAYLERLGVRREQVIGKSISEVLGEAAYEVISGHIDAALRGEKVQYEARLEYKHIGVRWVQVSYVPERDDDGTISGFIAAITDITPQKQAEETLRERENQFQVFVESAPAALAMFDREMRYLAVSRRFREDFGLNGEDLTGRCHYDLFPEIPERWREVHRRCLAGAVERADQDSFRDKEGALEWLKWEMRPWYKARGEVGGVVLACELITERMRSEEALRNSEARFRALADTAPAFIWSTSEQGAPQYVNRHFVDFTQQKLPRKATENWSSLLHPEDRDAFIEDFSDAIRRQTPFHARARLERQSDGEWRWIETYAMPLIESGKFAGHVGISLDVTDAVRSEEALKRSEARFRTAVSADRGLLWTNNARGEMEGEQPAWAAFTGQTYEEYKGYGWSKAVHPEDAQPTIDAWNAAVTERRIFVFEHRVRRHDGVWRLFSIRALPVLDEQGFIREWVGVHTDITEERGLLNAIRASEQRLRMVTDTAKIGLILLNAEHRYRFANQPYCDILGLGFTAANIIGLRVADALGLIYDLQIRPKLEKAFSGAKVAYELTIPPREGRPERRYAVTYQPGTDTDGTSVVIGVIAEITERVEAEKALARQLTLTRAITDNATTALFILDAQQQCVFMNPAAESLTGYSLQEAKGRTFHSVVHGDHADVLPYSAEPCPLQRGFPEHDQTKGEERFIHRDGSAYQAAFTASPIREGGGLVGTILEVQDITDRKRSEEALRAAENKLRRLEEAGIVGIVISNDEEIVEANDYFLRLLDYDRTELQAGLMNWRRLTPPEHLATSDEATRQLHETGTCPAFEKEYFRKDGSRIPVLVSSVSVGTAGNTGFLTLVIDQTERRGLEEQVRQAQKLETVGQLAGGVAHDFNNLLTVITGYGQMALSELDAEAALHDYVKEIVAAAGRATTLTRQLLTFSRRQRREVRCFALAGVVQQVEKMLRRVISEDIDLIFKLDKDRGTIRADSGQIEQVIMNLALNAKDAMPAGGRLLIETSTVFIDDQFASAHVSVAPGRYVMLSVADTGTGMSPEVLARMFEPFFTTKEQGKGTGLGLSTVYGVVKESEGSIWAESEPGRGTTFKCLFPAADIPETDLKPEPAEQNLRGDETILLAEDEPGLRKYVREVLERYGYTVFEARDGLEALDLAQKNSTRIELLLTDVVMPRMGGIELTSRFRDLCPHVPVLHMSGYTYRAVRGAEALDSYIQKPFTPSALLTRMRSLLNPVARQY